MKPASDDILELRVLGAMRLCRAGRPLALATRKVQALLLLLALDGGAGRERLCALLWPDLDDSAARRNLRRELARVREAGAREAVSAEGDRLLPGPGLAVDLLQAEAALAQGDTVRALALAQGAGELAEGLHLEDAPAFGPWLTHARERARRLRLQAHAAAASAAEARGDAAQALAQVQALLALDGLQERHHRTAMRLRAASGDRTGALQQFERCRALLEQELGLQPAPETLELAQSLRDVGSAPAPVPVRPRPDAGAWPAELPFVGREAEVARLQRAWSRGQPVVLAGEAGIGKTRLATDFAAAQGAHARVHAHAGDAELAFGTFARALRVLAGPVPDRAALDDWVLAELARLLPELGPAPAPLRGESDRLRFDEACLRAWAAWSQDAFDSLVLDDWQLADPASRALLARAAAARRECPPGAAGGAVEIVTWRGAADDPALRTLVETLAAELIVLEPLLPAQVYALVQHLSGAADPARFAGRLAKATGGHPFFIAETLRDLAERGLLQQDAQGCWRTPFDPSTEDYHELRLATSVRDAVLARVQRLPAAAARLLEAAALAGESFGAAWLASACALSELEALQALDEAAQAQLVRAHDGGGYGWGHDLARQALASALAPTRARLLHHRLALAAEVLGDPAAAARHFEACGEPARAAPHRLAAGDAAQALQALAEAVAHWQQGLADRPAPEAEAALRGRLCETLWAQGQADAARAQHEQLQALLAGTALTPAQRIDPQLRAAHYLLNSGRSQDSLALMQAMPEPDPPPLRVRWRVRRMSALLQCGRPDEALAEGQAALATVGATTGERAELLLTLSSIENLRGHIAEAVVRADESLALFTRLGDANGLARGLFYRGSFRSQLDDVGASDADLRESAALAARHGNLYLQRMALYNLASTYSNQTRPDEALAVAREAWPSMEREQQAELTLMFRALFIECLYARGEWGPLWDHLEPAVVHVLAGGQPLTMVGVANAALEPAAVLGQWAQVQPLVQALDGTVLDTVPGAEEVLLACAQAALIAGNPAPAARWLARVRPADQLEHPRVRCRVALLGIEQRLAAGAGPEVLEDLPADGAPGMSAELRLRALALRCAGAPTPALRQQARAALADERAHAGAALQLARVLGGEHLAARVDRLSAGMSGWPALQSGLRRTWLA